MGLVLCRSQPSAGESTDHPIMFYYIGEIAKQATMFFFQILLLSVLFVNVDPIERLLVVTENFGAFFCPPPPPPQARAGVGDDCLGRAV